MIDEADAINRILPSRLELWKQRREVRLLKREKTKERRKEIRVSLKTLKKQFFVKIEKPFCFIV